MKFKLLHMVLIFYYFSNRASSYISNTFSSSSPLCTKYYVKLNDSNAVPELKRKSIKSRKQSKSHNRNRKFESLDYLFSTDNDERKLIKEKAAYERYRRELNNPLLKKIAHDNQIKSGLKIKKLAKRAEKKSLNYLKKVLTSSHTTKSKSVNESTVSKDKSLKRPLPSTKIDKEQAGHQTGAADGNTEESESFKVYKRTKITERELRSLPLKAPGIRALDNSATNVSVEEIESLIKLGYDGIIDMNALFAQESGENKNKKGNGSESSDNMVLSDKIKFDSLGLYDKQLIRTLKLKGITRPTLTQVEFIPKLTSMLSTEVKRSLENVKAGIIHASTGSGKTLTYMLPIIQSCYNQSVPLFSRASIYGSGYDTSYESMLMYTRELLNQDILVICPSLELCVQSCNVAKQVCELYESMDINENESDYESELHKILGIESNTKLIRLKTEIKPTLLIGNANVVYQKKNIKKINALKAEEYEAAKKVIDKNREDYMLSKGESEPEGVIKRTVGMYFATPGRLYSILYSHKLLDVDSFKYIVMDEYDSYLENKNNLSDDVLDSDGNIKNKQTRRLIENMFDKYRNQANLNNNGESDDEYKNYLSNLRRKYVVCVSASNNINQMPEELRNHFVDEKQQNINVNDDSSVESEDIQERISKKLSRLQTTYEFPKNILHTMAIYSVPDAKLSLLRKILKSVPFNKSVLIFCDSNGTASFLYKYLSEIFLDSSIEILNSVQNRLTRKKAFSNLLQTNIDNTNLYNINKKSTRLVKDILISTRLNSRGIDFSGYTHVINYDLPHDSDSYIHKSGRIGRAGNPGICISLVEAKNFPAFKRVILDHLPIRFYKIDSNNGLLVTKT